MYITDKQMKEAKKAGYDPVIIINGEYYDYKPEKVFSHNEIISIIDKLSKQEKESYNNYVALNPKHVTERKNSMLAVLSAYTTILHEIDQLRP